MGSGGDLRPDHKTSIRLLPDLSSWGDQTNKGTLGRMSCTIVVLFSSATRIGKISIQSCTLSLFRYIFIGQ